MSATSEGNVLAVEEMRSKDSAIGHADAPGGERMFSFVAQLLSARRIVNYPPRSQACSPDSRRVHVANLHGRLVGCPFLTAWSVSWLSATTLSRSKHPVISPVSLMASPATGAMSDGVATADQVAALRPDVVLMDIRILRMDGVAAIARADKWKLAALSRRATAAVASPLASQGIRPGRRFSTAVARQEAQAARISGGHVGELPTVVDRSLPICIF